ncbi:hypothetical protein [Streptomyces sp. NBC_01718]|uniref:hypothetical protein n=1 Tax=unclassified Streptomyces TaxID=2593676 RepID=UPI00352DF857
MGSPTPAHSASYAWAWAGRPPRRKGFLAKLAGTREIHLDASALLFASGQLTDVVLVQQLNNKDGSVGHVATGQVCTRGQW